jgi:hypothetical protein
MRSCKWNDRSNRPVEAAHMCAMGDFNWSHVMSACAHAAPCDAGDENCPG